MIDRLVECDPGRRAVAVKTFPTSDLLFMDHFPGAPTVPGVLQVEMIAQTGGRCIRLARPDVSTLLAIVKSAKFVRPVEPGYQCRVSVDVVRLRRQFAVEWGVIDINGVRVCEAELMVAIVANHADPTYRDPILENWKQQQDNAGDDNSLGPGTRSVTIG